MRRDRGKEKRSRRREEREDAWLSKSLRKAQRVLIKVGFKRRRTKTMGKEGEFNWLQRVKGASTRRRDEETQGLELSPGRSKLEMIVGWSSNKAGWAQFKEIRAYQK